MITQIGAIWCPSCLVMNPIYDSVRKEVKEIKWQKLDIDFDASLVSNYQIGEKLPILIFEKEEKEVSRLVGEKTKEEILCWIIENR